MYDAFGSIFLLASSSKVVDWCKTRKHAFAFYKITHVQFKIKYLKILHYVVVVSSCTQLQ